MIRKSLLLASLVTVTVTAPAANAGAVTLEDVARPTPVAAYGGVVAWNAFDGSYRIRFSVNGGAPQDARVPRSPAPIQLDLGRGPGGRPRLVYSHGGDVYRLDDLAAGTPRRVAGAARSGVDEEWPTVEGDRVAFVRGDRHVFVTGRGAPREVAALNGGEARELELDRDRLALIHVRHEGDRRETQVLWLPRNGRRWLQVARAASGALSLAEFRSPSFAPRNRLLFAHERSAGGPAPQIASVLLSGPPRLRELPVTGAPVALDTDGSDVALVTAPARNFDPGLCGGQDVPGTCTVARLDAPAFRPAQPRGYSLARSR